MRASASRRSRRPSCVRLAAVLSVVLLPALAGAQEPSYGFSRSPDTVVVHYAIVYAQLEADDRRVTLDVHGDGRVVVHRPVSMKRAGDEVYTLSEAELEDLVRSLVERGLVELDAAATRRLLRGRRPAVLYQASDPPVVEIELNLERYRPAGSAAPERPVRRRLRWWDLEGDRRRHPDVPALRGLAEAEAQLRGLVRRRGTRQP